MLYCKSSPHATTNTQPTNWAPIELDRPVVAAKWPKVHILDKNGKKILFREEQIFWYPHIKDHRGTSFALFFWSGIAQNGPILGRNWPKLPILGQTCPFLCRKSFFGGEGAKLLVPPYHRANKTPLSCWKHWPRKWTILTPKNLIFGTKRQYFGTEIFVNRVYHQ